MYTPIAIVAVIVDRASGNSISRHIDPVDNARTGAGMLARSSSNAIIYHRDPADNASSNRSIHHGKLADNSIAGAGKLNTVYVGNNQYHISIVQLEKVSEIAWRKKARFDFLIFLVSYLSGGHNMSYIITRVANEVPMDTYSALQDA